jgi:hypothetical protein
VVVVPTVESDREVRVTLGAMHRQMMAVAESLTADEARVVVEFLERMREALQQSHQEEKK